MTSIGPRSQRTPFSGLKVASSGLTAQRRRIEVVAENIANANTIERDGKNAPYRRREPIFSVDRQGNGSAVRVSAIVEDPSPFRVESDPSHPLRDENGNVAYPNVQVIQEMVDMVVEFEKVDRPKTSWFGGIDAHHVYFEGLCKQKDGSYSVCWGS